MNKYGIRIAASFALAVAACGGSFFSWKAAPPAATSVGKVAVDVEDKRSGDQGGTNKKVVGTKPGFANIPEDIETDKATDVQDAFRDLTNQAAAAAGIGLLPPGDTAPTARIKVDVTQAYCQLPPFIPFAPFTANVTVTVKVLGMSDDTPVAGETLTAEGTDSSCEGSYKEALTQIFEKMTGALSAPAVKTAAAGGAAAPAAPAAPPAGTTP